MRIPSEAGKRPESNASCCDLESENSRNASGSVGGPASWKGGLPTLPVMAVSFGASSDNFTELGGLGIHAWRVQSAGRDDDAR
jgi:hypothetical protein